MFMFHFQLPFHSPRKANPFPVKLFPPAGFPNPHKDYFFPIKLSPHKVFPSPRKAYLFPVKLFLSIGCSKIQPKQV